jgi:hypothetical protein
MTLATTRKVLLGAAGAAALLAGGGMAYASTDSEVISGCYNNTNGSLRVLTSDACKGNETAIEWNQEGPQGMPGPQGQPGADGAQGPAGPQGMMSTLGTTTEESPYSLGPEEATDALVWCSPGDEAISGG